MDEKHFGDKENKILQSIIDKNSVKPKKSFFDYYDKENKVYNIIKQIFCIHEFDLGIIQPFTDINGHRYMKYVCKKCGKSYIRNECKM